MTRRSKRSEVTDAAGPLTCGAGTSAEVRGAAPGSCAARCSRRAQVDRRLVALDRSALVDLDHLLTTSDTRVTMTDYEQMDNRIRSFE